MQGNNYVKDVRELRAYQEAFSISLIVHKASLGFPKIEQYALADQMRRASKSICANLAEGFAKQSTSVPEFRRFIQMAAGSSAEMKVWVEYAEALDYISKEQAAVWIDKYDYISRMLQNLRKNIESSSHRVLESSEEV